MLLLEGILLGIVVGVLAHGRLDNVRHVRLSYESFFLAALVAYVVWPWLGSVLGVGQREYIVVWALVALLCAGLALANSRYLGMLLAATGLVANVLVVAANGAMPVDVARAGTDVSRIESRLSESMLHEPLDEGTSVTWLADTIFVPGPEWHRALVSVGDVMLAVGAGLVAYQMVRQPANQSSNKRRGSA